MAFRELNEEIALTLSETAPQVRVAVKDVLVKREQQARADAVLSVIEKIGAAIKALYKIKEDQTTYNLDGSVMASGYTKTKLDERKKVQEEIDRLEKALGAALSPAEGQKYDFSKVKELAAKGGAAE